MIVDSHHHFFTKQQYTQVYEAYGCPDILKPLLKDFSPTDMRPLMDEVGIDKTVLIQMEETLEHTYNLLRIADAYPWVEAVVGWVDLKDSKLGKHLDALVDQPKFRGIRHPLEHEADPHWILDDQVLAGLRELAARNYVFDLLVGPRHWDFLPKIAQAAPELIMVIEHFGRPDVRSLSSNDWAQKMRKMAQYPNVYCKLSGIMVLIPDEKWDDWDPVDFKNHVEKTIELFGVDRVMYGSDWPVSTLVGSYRENLEAIQYCVAGMSSEEKSKIFVENARRVYHIS